MTELTLWPGDEKITAHDEWAEGTEVPILNKLARPTLSIHPASAAAGAPTVLVCPGGGYSILAAVHEGTEIAEFLNSRGIHAAVVKYRLPANPGGSDRYFKALEDAQRALCLLRHHGREWRINPGRVGIMGFSAGGHLAAVTSNTAEHRRLAGDAADAHFALPDFTGLIYPAYLDPDGDGVLAPECPVTAKTPPAFLVHALDDPIPHWSSRTYSLLCQKAGVPAELHLFPKGGHGYGLRTKIPGLSRWGELMADWLKSL